MVMESFYKQDNVHINRTFRYIIVTIVAVIHIISVCVLYSRLIIRHANRISSATYIGRKIDITYKMCVLISSTTFL
jgi:hypothetical protein